MNKNTLRISLLAAIAITGICATQTQAAAWNSPSKWGEWKNGGYIVRNNVWGDNVGWQTIWANSGANWGVSCSHSGGGIKSYPHSDRDINKLASSISTLGTSFNVSRPSTGAYTTTFDVWANGDDHEIMLWMNKQGAIGPIGSLKFSNVSVGGHTWNVYRGYNGSINVMSFVRTSNTNSGNVDHKAIFNWIQNKGWWSNPTIRDVQFGFEITNTNGTTQNFNCNSRSDWSS